jgi:transcriptional regulator with XRE-family HTH domain
MGRPANGHSRIGHNSQARGAIWITRSYNCIDADPECDRFRAIIRGERLKDTDVAALAGVGDRTVTKLVDGSTRNPRHSTFAKLAGGLGFEYDLVRKVEPNYDREIPKAREQRKIYRAQLARKRERQQQRKG